MAVHQIFLHSGSCKVTIKHTFNNFHLRILITLPILLGTMPEALLRVILLAMPRSKFDIFWE